MIVDDHPIVRDGHKSVLLITDDLTLVAEADNGREAVAKCREVKPDVVLMDIVMPGMDGIEATRAILRQSPDVRIVVLTTFSDEQLLQNALDAGSFSYLLKNSSADKVIEAIYAAAEGLPTLSPEATSALINIGRNGQRLGGDLTRREKEVLVLMIEGKTNAEIAEILTISLGTVRHHVSACIAKLDATNRTHAVALAVEHQLTR